MAPAYSNGRYRSSLKLNSKLPESFRAELVVIEEFVPTSLDVNPSFSFFLNLLLVSIRLALILV